MNRDRHRWFVAPKVTPVLDPAFRPAVLACRAFEAEVRGCADGIPVRIALEQNASSVSHFATTVFPESHASSEGNFVFVERLCRFLLWSRGGCRLYIDGPEQLAKQLAAYYRETQTGQFDSELVGSKMFDHPLEVIHTRDLPKEKSLAAPLGRNMDGCRIGFDLGGSDRKVAAVIDGKVVFSEETTWSPYFEKDPEYHFQGIMDSLRAASAHLPRVDAIGGSAAGVYVGNRVKVASLFRGVPPDVFASRVKNLFFEVQKAWNNVPLEVVNDGEVTALAGSMSLNKNRIIGISLGTSTAGGYVNAQGNITSWINELAFCPVDYNPQAPVDEWSRDYGCGVQYFSQQAVSRLLPVAGIETESSMPLSERLKHTQELMVRGDDRARKVYETLGVYLGYGVAHVAKFYDLENVLILGRVTSGEGGDIILENARKVLETEFPELASSIAFHVPNEQDKRHGQAVAAASLPRLH